MRQLKIVQSITLRDSQSLEKYLTEVSRVDLITADEEVELAKRIKQGDQEALEKLVKANLRFVVSVAKQYQNSYLSLNDLISEGNLGLVKAAQRFDETRGFKFISYAVWWIRQSIIQAISEQGRVIRIPLNRIGALSKIKKTFADLEQQYEREPTAQEIAEVTDLNLNQVTDTMKVAASHVSLDAPFNAEDTNSFLDILEDNEAVMADKHLEYNASMSIDINQALSSLTSMQKEVIEKYYGIGMKEPMSLQDIGDSIGLTRERIRQIKDKALAKLRTSSTKQLLETYLCQ